MRVLSELYEARLHEAQSVAEYLALWMYGRDVHPRGRIAGTGFDTKGRFEAAFRQHLLLALQVALNVKAACPEFALFGEKHELREQALADVNEELLSSKDDEVMKMIDQRPSIAKRREPDFVLVPLSFFTEARCLPVLDSICRLLGSKRGVETEFKCVWQTLPSRGKDKNGKDIDDETDIQGLQAITKVLADLLGKKLIGVGCVPTSQACSH